MKVFIAFACGAMLLGGLSGCSLKHAVPALEGMDLKSATRTLEQHGFQLGQVQKEFTGTNDSGAVLRQMPGSLEKAAAGSSIDLIVEESVTVPDLTGLGLEAATSTLVSNALRPGKVDKKFVTGAVPGTVVGQQPVAASRVANTNCAVTLVVALAKGPAKGPSGKDNLAGLGAEWDTGTISEAVTDAVSEAASDAAKKGVAKVFNSIFGGGKKKSAKTSDQGRETGPKPQPSATVSAAGGKPARTNDVVALERR